MRRLPPAAGFLALGLGLALGLATSCAAAPALTTAPATMHRAPNPNSRVVQTIPPNAQIDIENCGPDWCYGSWRHLFGYVPAFAVAQGGSPMISPPPPPLVVAAPPIILEPTFGWGGGYVGGGWGPGWHHW